MSWRVDQTYGYGAARIPLSPEPFGRPQLGVSLAEGLGCLSDELRAQGALAALRNGARMMPILLLSLVLAGALIATGMRRPQDTGLRIVRFEPPPVPVQEPAPVVDPPILEEPPIPEEPVARVQPRPRPELPPAERVAKLDPPPPPPTPQPRPRPAPPKARPAVPALPAQPTPPPPPTPARARPDLPRPELPRPDLRIDAVARAERPRPAPSATPARRSARPSPRSERPFDVADVKVPALRAPATRERVSLPPAPAPARSAPSLPARGDKPRLAMAAPPAPARRGVPRPAAAPRRAAPTPQPPASPSDPQPRLRGVALGSLAACVSDRREDELKLKVMAARGNADECRSEAGRYRFVETRNLNAFLMWVERAPGRAEADRCIELSLALECLASGSKRAGTGTGRRSYGI
jgi:hypothetical protein